MFLTRHAEARQRQRSIPSYVIAATYAFGTDRGVRDSAISYTLDREAIELARESYPDSISKALTKYLGVYLIIGNEGKIVTVARGRYRSTHH